MPYGIRAYGVSGFTSDWIMNTVRVVKPQCFDDIVKIISLSYSDRVWSEKIEQLFRKEADGTEIIISSQEDIFDYLLLKGIDKKFAFELSRQIGEGKGLDETDIAMLESEDIPKQFIEKCSKKGRLGRKSDAYRDALNSWWCAWFKLHYPKEYVETFEEMFYD